MDVQGNGLGVTERHVFSCGLDYTDVTGKEAFENLADLIKSLLEWPNIKVPDSVCGVLPKLQQDLVDCKKCLRRHIEEHVKQSDRITSHCMTHALNPDQECEHEHGQCEVCLKPFML